MAFKRSNFKSLISTKKEYFGSTYSFNKKTNFGIGSDVYVIPLGLESGYYETPCHRVKTHEVDGKTIGFNGSKYDTYIKCKGNTEEGVDKSALCCTLAQMERERIPEKSEDRIISGVSWRVHLPVLILGNSLSDESKNSYPVTKVALSKDLASETGLKFSFLEMASGTFKTGILTAFGNKLKEEGTLDYDLNEDSEEFLEEVRQRLSRTIIKVHGGTKQGWKGGAIKEYSFFPFENPTVAHDSGAGERELILNYQSNDRIMLQISEFLTLFDTQVDTIVNSWNEKDLQEYYNSARGVALSTPLENLSEKEETVEIIAEPVQAQPATNAAPVVEVPTPAPAPVVPPVPQEVAPAPVVEAPKPSANPQPVLTNTSKVLHAEPEEVSADDTYNFVDKGTTDSDIDSILNNPVASEGAKVSDASLDEFEFDMDEDGDFFEG